MLKNETLGGLFLKFDNLSAWKDGNSSSWKDETNNNITRGGCYIHEGVVWRDGELF